MNKKLIKGAIAAAAAGILPVLTDPWHAAKEPAFTLKVCLFAAVMGVILYLAKSPLMKD
jgi:hypothetical protein